MQQRKPEIGTRRDLVLYRLETAKNDLKSSRALFALGTLFYMAGRGDITISSRESAELERYRDARNKLAHMNVLDNEELYMLLKAGKRKM